MRQLDDTGKLHARKRARAVWRREVGIVPQQWGNSSASYPTRKPCSPFREGSETMRFPTRAPDQRSSRHTRPGGRTITASTILPIVSVRTGDTTPLTCYAGCWDAPTPKRCSRGRCTPRSLSAISTDTNMSDLSIGGCLGKMASPEKRFPCGSMRIQ